MRVDAKAEGMIVAVGGWAPRYNEDGSIAKHRSLWFSIRLDEKSAPWAYAKGMPSRTISTLELLASTIGLVLLAPAGMGAEGSSGIVAVTGHTDSQVSSHVVTRGLTTTYPLCCVAMEMAAQLESLGA